MNKRTIEDILSNSLEEDIEYNKKTRLEMDEIHPVYVVDVDKMYLNDPKKLKDDLEINFGDLKIAETKITAKGD